MIDDRQAATVFSKPAQGESIAKEVEDHVKQLIAWGQRLLSQGLPALKPRLRPTSPSSRPGSPTWRATRLSSCWRTCCPPRPRPSSRSWESRLGDRHRGQ
jgi:hypothetical protein